MSYSIPQAVFIGCLLECIFYGTYFLVFLECITTMHRKRWEGGKSVWFVIVASALLFVSSTMHLMLDIQRIYYSFTSLPTVDAVTDYWNDISSCPAMFSAALFNIIIIFSSIFIVYRCWVAWDRSFLVAAVPFSLFLVDFTLAIWVARSRTISSIGNPTVAAQVEVHTKAFFVITLAINLLATLMIAYRIYSTQRALGQWAKSPFSIIHNTSAILIDSAAAYSTLFIILIAAAFENSTLQLTMLLLIPAASGLVFSYITLRDSRDVGEGGLFTQASSNTQRRLSRAQHSGAEERGSCPPSAAPSRPHSLLGDGGWWGSRKRTSTLTGHDLSLPVSPTPPITLGLTKTGLGSPATLAPGYRPPGSRDILVAAARDPAAIAIDLDQLGRVSTRDNDMDVTETKHSIQV